MCTAVSDISKHPGSAAAKAEPEKLARSENDIANLAMVPQWFKVIKAYYITQPLLIEVESKNR